MELHTTVKTKVANEQTSIKDYITGLIIENIKLTENIKTENINNDLLIGFSKYVMRENIPTRSTTIDIDCELLQKIEDKIGYLNGGNKDKNDRYHVTKNDYICNLIINDIQKRLHFDYTPTYQIFYEMPK